MTEEHTHVHILSEARDWHPLVDDMTDVQKLVHLAARWDVVDQETWRGRLLRSMRTVYNEELWIMASHLGCTGQRGQLRNESILSALDEIANADAASIVNTYNYDLSLTIKHIYAENPRSNRHVYAFRINKWGDARRTWKKAEIETTTEAKARLAAQRDFLANNGRVMESAILVPRTAVCPICQGWIDRGRVPSFIAMANPPPYHVRCPHTWSHKPFQKMSKEQCALLWMGA